MCIAPCRPPWPRPQLAKARGLQVATTCSGRNVEFVKGLGADEVVDYTQQRFEGERPPPAGQRRTAVHGAGAGLALLCRRPRCPWTPHPHCWVLQRCSRAARLTR